MPTKLVVDCSTGIQTLVELTAEEVAQSLANQKAYEDAEAAQVAAAAETVKSKKSANDKLKALGLTDAEIAALVS
tara:strand:- start:1667 stop:1891 length:225 start_codon:yes stop_codon:yes gene_type:complete